MPPVPELEVGPGSVSSPHAAKSSLLPKSTETPQSVTVDPGLSFILTEPTTRSIQSSTTVTIIVGSSFILTEPTSTSDKTETHSITVDPGSSFILTETFLSPKSASITTLSDSAHTSKSSSTTSGNTVGDSSSSSSFTTVLNIPTDSTNTALPASQSSRGLTSTRFPPGAVAGITVILLFIATCCLCVYRWKRYSKKARTGGELEDGDAALVSLARTRSSESASMTTPRPFVLDPAAPKCAGIGWDSTVSEQLDHKWVILEMKAVGGAAPPGRNSDTLSTQTHEMVKQGPGGLGSSSTQRESSSSATVVSAMTHAKLRSSSITSSVTTGLSTGGDVQSIVISSGAPPTYRSRLSSQINFWSRHVSILKSL